MWVMRVVRVVAVISHGEPDSRDAVSASFGPAQLSVSRDCATPLWDSGAVTRGYGISYPQMLVIISPWLCFGIPGQSASALAASKRCQ